MYPWELFMSHISKGQICTSLHGGTVGPELCSLCVHSCVQVHGHQRSALGIIAQALHTWVL